MAFSNVTQTTVASEFIPGLGSSLGVLTREIVKEARAAVVIAPLISHWSLEGKEGKSISVPKWPTISASAVSEATDLANTAINPTQVTLTASEVGLMATITDLLTKSDIIEELTGNDQYSKLLGRAIGTKIDVDIATLFTALNGGSAVGTSGTDITINDFLQAIYTLDNAEARGQYQCVLHPVQYHHLRKALQVATGIVYGGKEEFTLNGQIGRFFGVNVFQTTNVQAGGTSIDKAGAMFVKEALGMLTKWSARTELERNASLRATEVVETTAYAVGEIVDTFGVSIETDATV